MSKPLYMQKEYRTTNEPKVHSLVRKSFIFVKSAGMRLAPEVLILELMREVFFEQHHGRTTGIQYLDADQKAENNDYLFTDKERAVLHALRGRRKKSKTAHAKSFFPAVYPTFANHGWLGKNRERVIHNFLFSGLVAQHLWGKDGPDSKSAEAKQEKLANKVCGALRGKKSCLNNSTEGKEFLAVMLGPDKFKENLDLARQNIVDKTKCSDSVMRINTHDDGLAARATGDLCAICSIEGEIPRMQWLQLLMTFLRFALPMWVLAQMQITRLLHGWLLRAVDRGNVVDNPEITQKILNRNRGLLHPTLTATRELFEHIELYMKNRIEVDILLYCLQETRPNARVFSDEKFTLGEPKELKDLLLLARDASSDIKNSKWFKSVAKGSDIRTFLMREGECFSAWRSPFKSGQGKNIDEFFRVLYRAELGDEEGGYLLTPEGQGPKRGFRVFPGQQLLKMATYLADQGKNSNQQPGGTGKLVIEDVENLFSQYGIDFSTAADARPLLMKELQTMGLLSGSPDAGNSAAVSCPY